MELERVIDQLKRLGVIRPITEVEATGLLSNFARGRGSMVVSPIPNPSPKTLASIKIPGYGPERYAVDLHTAKLSLLKWFIEMGYIDLELVNSVLALTKPELSATVYPGSIPGADATS